MRTGSDEPTPREPGGVVDASTAGESPAPAQSRSARLTAFVARMRARLRLRRDGAQDEAGDQSPLAASEAGVGDMAMEIATGTGAAVLPASPPATVEARTPSRLAAAVLSFLWPGLGELYLRRRISAVLFALPVLLVLGWLCYQFLHDRGVWFALAMLDSSFAIAVVAVTIALCALRIVSMAHAYLIAGPGRRPSVIESAMMVALLAIVVAAHAEVAYLASAVYQFDVDVASNQLQQSGVPTNTLTPMPSATATPTWQPGGSVAPVTPVPSVTPEPHKSHHLTIMLAGLDWLPGRSGGQYDALMLVSLDTDTHKVAMVSFPRDTANFDFYWGGQAGINTKINNFANLVERNQIHAPAPPAGMPMSQYKFVVLGNELGYLAGIKVDYYAVIDMQGFINLVEFCRRCLPHRPQGGERQIPEHVHRRRLPVHVRQDGPQVRALPARQQRLPAGQPAAVADRGSRPQAGDPGGAQPSAQAPVAGLEDRPDQLPAQHRQGLCRRHQTGRHFRHRRHPVRPRPALRLPPGHHPDQGRLDEPAHPFQRCPGVGLHVR